MSTEVGGVIGAKEWLDEFEPVGNEGKVALLLGKVWGEWVTECWWKWESV